MRFINDHRNYTDSDVADIYEEAKYLEADVILATQKDWVKTALLAIEKYDIPFAYLTVRMEFVDGEDKIVKLIEKTIKTQLSSQGKKNA